MTDPDPQSRRGLVGAAAVPAGPPSAARAPEDDLAVVRARTQREIDDEIASLGEVPFFSFSGSDDTAASDEADAGPAAESAPTDLREAAVPTGADEPGDGDPFGWLFRAAVRPTAPAPATGHPTTAPVSDPTGHPVAHSMDSGEPTEPFRPSFAASPTEDTGPMPAALFAPAAPVRPAAPFAGSAPVTPAGPRAVLGARPGNGAPPRSRGRRGAAAALVVSLCLVVAAAGAVVGAGGLNQLPWAHLGQSSAVSSPTPSSPAAVPGQVWDGEVAAIDGVGVTAGCVAEPALDAAGNTVTYGPTNLLDDDPNTAWRCDEQTAPSITFTIPEGRQVAEVGLINGYAKVDPRDGSDRYPEYRRVMLVRWTLPNGSSVEQLLEDETATMQRIRIPVTEGPLTLTVLRVTNPGTTTAGREAVVISDVVFAAPR
ncbi:NADase-type glycan-binding domain-containing protein [Microlunatus sp. Y2014]|uniref:NADase-type glycan-binding domain-containing protein n=1 Tax=Microlunatus sp. Y2014 TaxID=3418488 RepID=UPI003DA74846